MKTGDNIRYKKYKQAKIKRKITWVEDGVGNIILTCDAAPTSYGHWKAKGSDGLCASGCEYIVTWRDNPDTGATPNVLFVRCVSCTSEEH